MKRRLFLAAAAASFLTGCGFQLRRFDEVSFDSLYIEAPGDSAVAPRVRTALTLGRITRLAESPQEAEVVLKLGPETRSRTILSLSGAGRVTEFRLGMKLTYSVVGPDGRELAAAETLELIRDMTYDDTQLLAKTAEEQLLFRDMADAAALRIIRRLHSIPAGSAS